MRRFLIDSVVCFCIFILIWSIAEYSKEKIYLPNAYSYKYKYVKGNPSIKTLLIGHSHFENSINPYLMGDSIYDYAISGRRWIYWDVKLAEQIIPTMPNLKTIIFPLGYVMPYESPHYQPLSDVIKDNIYQYGKFMHVTYDRFPENYWYKSALVHNDMKIHFWREKNQDKLGYYKLEGQCDEWQTDQNTTSDIFKGDIAHQCYSEFKEYFIQLAKICYDNNIRFIAVTCPCADCYVQNTRPQGIKNLCDLVDSVRAYYPIEYFNYLNDPEFRADSLYYNCSHLNSIGADKFAIRLKYDLGL